MLTDDEIERSLANCDMIRHSCSLRFLQVLPDPKCADNIQLRIGQGAWTTMHIKDAKAFVLAAVRKQRSDAKLDKATKDLRRSLKAAKKKQIVRKARERLKRTAVDSGIRAAIRDVRALLKQYR